MGYFCLMFLPALIECSQKLCNSVLCANVIRPRDSLSGHHHKRNASTYKKSAWKSSKTTNEIKFKKFNENVERATATSGKDTTDANAVSLLNTYETKVQFSDSDSVVFDSNWIFSTNTYIYMPRLVLVAMRRYRFVFFFSSQSSAASIKRFLSCYRSDIVKSLPILNVWRYVVCHVRALAWLACIGVV